MTSRMCGVWSGLSLSISVLAIVIYHIPPPIHPDPYTFEEGPPALTGPLSRNRKLQRAAQLFPGKLFGPESFANDDQGWLYTGTADGQLWRIRGDIAEVINRTGEAHDLCGTFDYEPLCGRPKGMAMHPDGHLYVADCYKGLLRVNVTSGRIDTLLTGYDGIPFRFLNGLDITSDGVIYFTDSSTKWDRRNFRYEVIETNKLGRVIRYDPSTGAHVKVLDGLYLANGLALSPDQTFIVVSEMSVCKITRFYISGPRAGQREVLHSNLPGYPDNIRLTSHGTFYVSLASTRFQGSSRLGSFLDLIAPYPAVKRFITKVTPFAVYPLVQPKHAILLEMDTEGNILHSFHDDEGAVIRIGLSEAYEHEDYVYLGSFSAKFLGRISKEELYS